MEASYCNLSLTLSLGSTTSRGDIPARLSRAGSLDQDLTWSLALRSDQRVDPSRAHTCEPDRSAEQAMSWGGSCDRSDLVVSMEHFPQVLVCTIVQENYSAVFRNFIIFGASLSVLFPCFPCNKNFILSC